MRTNDTDDPLGGPVTALTHAVVGASAVGIVALLPSHEPPHLSWGSALLGLWLCVAGIVIYIGIWRTAWRSRSASAAIPLRFTGATGRFSLRPRGDGTRVEVMADEAVVAEIVASDLGDEIVIDTAAVAEGDVVDLGSAIGQAIEMAAAAEEEYVAALKSKANVGIRVRHLPSRAPRVRSWAPSWSR